ncbi:tRNA threonylcarbamoyladenosine dehydratase [Leeia sp. TBRC 13508]|uniref:tRNA threonylcarbamoyladenosine dehydratase n=1 Tax=Leeia speluncae TaxID=2884804 RepID=A0ABS8D5N9_9NEIS|nr:tRNA threonylcarbamoyladenosine dehydratase [Leeia speluncae]MCB6183524.1 tRNA threonylcarbamoyladenosine dehydratase [Leeia speluncae]
MASTTSHDQQRRFGGIGRLYGQEKQQRFETAHVMVVGIGGVGTWVVEALARTGIGKLTLIDLDNVAVSNVNRQIHALEGNFGKAKTTAMAERVRQINPLCQVVEIEDFLTPENMHETILSAEMGKPDVIIDAIDQAQVKIALINFAKRYHLRLVVSGGAGGKMDPTRIQIKDLAEVIQDPLLAKVRNQLRKLHGFPNGQTGKKMGVTCVFSDEPLQQPISDSCEVGASGGGLNCAGYGSAMVVTAGVGLQLAAAALSALSKPKK